MSMNYAGQYTKLLEFAANKENSMRGEPGRNLEILASYVYVATLELEYYQKTGKRKFYQVILPQKNKEYIDAYYINKKDGQQGDRGYLQFTCKKEPKEKMKTLADFDKEVTLLYGKKGVKKVKTNANNVNFVNIYDCIKKLEAFAIENKNDKLVAFLNYLFEECVNTIGDRYAKANHYVISNNKAEIINEGF